MGLTRVQGSVKPDKIFNTIAEAKAVENAAIGDVIQTIGYASANDGGGALYRVVAAATGTDDGGSYHDMTNVSGQLELITEGTVNVKVFGAIGDGAAPDAAAFVNAVAYLSSSGGVVEGVSGDTYLLTKQDADSCIKLNQVLGVSLKGNGATLKLDAAQNCHIIKVIGDSTKATAGELEISGWVMDSNKTNNTDNPSNQDTIRLTNCHDIKVFDNVIKSTNSNSVVMDGTDDVHVFRNYIYDVGRNGVIVGCSSTIDGNRNKVYENRIEDTGLNSIGNGIFATASNSSVSTTTNQYDFQCWGNDIDDSGDIGIESGIRCVRSIIALNNIKGSKNQAIIVRDNYQPTVYGNNIIIDNALSGTKSGITFDTQLGAGDGNEVTTANGLCYGNNITGIDASGIEIRDIDDFVVHGNILVGADKTGNIGVNIKGNDVVCYGNKIKTLQRGVRIAEDNLTALTGIMVYGNRLDDITDAILLENVDLSYSMIYNNLMSSVTNRITRSGTVTVDNVQQYGNRSLDSFGNPGSNLDEYINSHDGFTRASPASQFGTVSIMAPAYNSAFRIKGDTTGESAVFSVDASTPSVTKIAGSAKYGVAADSTDYRIEVSGSNIVVKRYSVSQTIDNFTIEFM